MVAVLRVPLASSVKRVLWSRIPCPADELVGQGGINIRIGRVELADYCADRLVLGDGQECEGS